MTISRQSEKKADGWVVYGTPFSGKTDEQLNRKGKLQGICMLERGKTNEIRRMDPQEAVLLLMRQTLVPRRQEMAERLLGMLDELFSGSSGLSDAVYDFRMCGKDGI